MNEQLLEVLNLNRFHRRALITDDEFLFEVKGIHVRSAHPTVEQQDVWDAAIWSAEQGRLDINWITGLLLDVLK